MLPVLMLRSNHSRDTLHLHPPAQDIRVCPAPLPGKIQGHGDPKYYDRYDENATKGERKTNVVTRCILAGVLPKKSEYKEE